MNFHAYLYDSGIVLVPLQLMQDSAFDVEAYMSEQVGKVRLARRLNRLGTTGSGSDEPTGILTAATLGNTSASASAITYAELIDLKFSVDPAYRPGAGWMFADSTLRAIKSLVDGNGRPLFIAGGVAEGIQNRNPDRIDGDPFTINQDMPAIGAGNKPIVYGVLSKFKVRLVRGTQLVVFRERYMHALQLGFMAFCRFDTNLVDAGTHPVKYLQCAAS